VGLEHPHAFGIAFALQGAGADIVSFCSARPDDDLMVSGFGELFPTATKRADIHAILANDAVDVVVPVAIPCDRCHDARVALGAGRHVLADKPIAIDQAQLNSLRAATAASGETGESATTKPVFGVWFSERFESRATGRAIELVADGAIGDLVEVIGLGPHRLSAESRPEWFFDASRAGTLLTDLMTHQVDQFLHLATISGHDPASVRVVNAQQHLHHGGTLAVAGASLAGFTDHASIDLQAGKLSAYLRVDWLSPAGLDTWGDVRLMLTGTAGSIEVRKNIDLASPTPGGDHLLLANGDGVERVDCADVALPHATAFLDACRGEPTWFANPDHTFRVLELCLDAARIAAG